MTEEQRLARIAELQRMLQARQDVPGYRKNLDALQAEIDRLKADNGQAQ